jgi:predicted phosphate transport protein (TIGR00153 family)
MPLIVGKNTSFYQLLEAQAQVAVRAAQQFLILVKDFENLEAHAKTIDDMEHEGDELTHQLQNKVASTFITPLDKEDLRDLSQVLDDITDAIEAVAARAELYKLKVARPDLEPLAVLLVKATAITRDAVAELSNGFNRSTTLKDKLKEIHTVENESDQVFRRALGSLFEEPGIAALDVMKWKEVYDRIETAIDKCEDIAKIIGTVIVKYA